jgi:hypothetical protein
MRVRASPPSHPGRYVQSSTNAPVWQLGFASKLVPNVRVRPPHRGAYLRVFLHRHRRRESRTLSATHNVRTHHFLGSHGACEVIPIFVVIRRESQQYSPLAALICSTLYGVASGVVVVAEQMQLANMIWDRDSVHSTRAETRPGRNPCQLLSAQRGLNSLGQPRTSSGLPIRTAPAPSAPMAMRGTATAALDPQTCRRRAPELAL